MRLPVRLLIVALTLTTLTSLKAADFYNNLSQTPDNYLAPSDTVLYALSFKTTASVYSVTDVTIPVMNVNNLVTGNVVVSLYDATGASSTPGNKIGSDLGITPISSYPSASYQNYSITGLNVSLSPSTNYYIVISGSGLASPFRIPMITSASGNVTGSLGVTSLPPTPNPTWAPPNNGAYIIGSISSNTAVPEPSTYAMVTIATGALGILARRRKG